MIEHIHILEDACLGLNRTTLCSQQKLGNDSVMSSYYYINTPDEYFTGSYVLFKLYPKDKNPRRSQRDLALANIKQTDSND